MNSVDKRDIEIKAKHNGMFLSPGADNDPNMPEDATYWLVDEATGLPCNVDPASLEEIDRQLSKLSDKGADPRPDPMYGDGTEA